MNVSVSRQDERRRQEAEEDERRQQQEEAERRRQEEEEAMYQNAPEGEYQVTTVNSETFVPVVVVAVVVVVVVVVVIVVVYFIYIVRFFGSRSTITEKFAPGDVCDWSQFPRFLYCSSTVSRRITFAISHPSRKPHRIPDRKGFRVYGMGERPLHPKSPPLCNTYRL